MALRIKLDSGRTLAARLTPTWTPDVAGAEPLRVFVAIDETDIDVGNDGVQPGELDAVTRGRYTIEAQLEDGRTVKVAPGA